MTRFVICVTTMLLVSYASGCGNPVELQDDLFAGVHAIVSGRVVASGDEAPVEGAEVEVRVFASDCGAGRAISNTSTDSRGEFTLGIGRGNTGPFEGCLTIGATPPEDSRLGPADTSGIRLNFVDADSVPDTAFVVLMSLPR